jgi:hypothetical protein
MSTLLAFVESYFADPDYSTRIVAPAVDYFTVDIGATGDSIWMIVNPILNFTNGAITLPPASSAVNDQEITVVFTAAVSTFVITSAGATVLGAPVQIGGYDSFRVRYNAAQLTWYTLDTTGDGTGSGVSQIVRQDFTGDGTTTTFTLTTAPSGLGNELQIFIDGVYQERAGYTVTGSNVVFSEAPPSLSNIEVLGWAVSIGAETSANLVSYTPAGTGAVLTTVQAKLRESVSVKDFGAVGDGVADDTAAIQAAIAATGTGKLIFPKATYLITSPLVFTAVSVDFQNSKIIYAGATNFFALTFNAGSTGSTTISGTYENLLLVCTSTDTVNRTHGICLGGSLGALRSAVITGFTGISLALGSGVESYTGVTLTATSQCYYWDIESINIASTAGWNYVIKTSNNANNFVNLSTFPYNGFGGATAALSNCINQMVIGGTGNTFERVSFESSASGTTLLFLATANTNTFVGANYIEYNASYATPPFPRVVAQAQSSANEFSFRHPYTGTTPTINLTSWSDFSTNTVVSYITGYPSGKALRLVVTAGRPNVQQNVVAISGYDVAALIGSNITVSCWMRTDITGMRVSMQGLTQNNALYDGSWNYFSSTTKVPTGATAVSIGIISAGNPVTGYVEVSNLVVTLGRTPISISAKTEPVGSATYDPPSIASAGQATTTVPVPGAALGDYATASFSLDLQAIELSAYVNVADTVTCIFKNGTAGAIDLASGTLRCKVTKA